MGNLISRQAVINMKGLLEDWTGKEYEAVLVEDIERLPSAEPKIIRCNECKWNRTENRKETKQWLPCRAIVTPDDFSCIYAEGKANG